MGRGSSREGMRSVRGERRMRGRRDGHGDGEDDDLRRVGKISKGHRKRRDRREHTPIGSRRFLPVGQLYRDFQSFFSTTRACEERERNDRQSQQDRNTQKSTSSVNHPARSAAEIPRRLTIPKIITVDKKSIAESTVLATSDIELDNNTIAIFPPNNTILTRRLMVIILCTRELKASSRPVEGLSGYIGASSPVVAFAWVLSRISSTSTNPSCLVVVRQKG